MDHLLTPAGEIASRIQTLKSAMAVHGMDAVFLTHKPDIFYFCGTAQECFLYIAVDHEPILFVKRYLPRAVTETSLEQAIQIGSVKNIPKMIMSIHGTLPKSCGLALDVVPAKDFFFLETLFKQVKFADCTSMIHNCRKIKSDWEIERIKDAAALSKKIFGYIEKHLRPGISEMEFCGECETFARKFGHSGLLRSRHYRFDAYPFHLLSGNSGGMAGAVDTPCCGSGTSAAHPSGAGLKRIRENEPILIDFGTVLNGYHMDETRMFAVSSMDRQAEYAFQIAAEILEIMVDGMKPGVAVGELFDKAVRFAGKKGLEDQFLGLSGIKSQFIAHGIGLELVEPPFIAKGKSDLLAPGMVFAVEPKFIFKDRFAAGIESVVHVNGHRAELLSVTPPEIKICKHPDSM